MIGLRNEVVHKGSTELDDALAPMFLSNCLNFEAAIVDLFGQRCSLEPHLRFALQFRYLVPPSPRSEATTFQRRGLHHPVRNETAYHDPEFT